MKSCIPLVVLFAIAVGCGRKSGPVAPSPTATKDQQHQFAQTLGPNADGVTTLKADDLGVECTLIHATEKFTDADLAMVPDPGFAFGLRQQLGPLTDAGLADLASRPSLVLLDLQYAKTLSVRGAAAVGKMRNLKWLQLSGCGVTDDWLSHLRGLTNLRNLGLGGNKGLTDAGLVHLSGMTKLKRLCLNEARVTGTGLASLAGAKELDLVELPDTGDAAVKTLAKIGKLHALGDARTATDRRPKSAAEVTKFSVRGGLTDGGLKELKALPNLKELYLNSQKITAASIPFLSTMRALKVLELNTAMIPQEREQLKKALPGCDVR